MRALIVAGMCTLLCLTAYATRWDRSPSQECARVVQLPRTNDIYFGRNALTWSSFLQLASNGTYRVLECQHLYVEESDRGIWTQSAGDKIVFTTTRTGYSINCGPLAFCFAALHRPELVVRTRDRVTNLLTTTDADSYKAGRVIKLAGLIDPAGYDRPLIEVAAEVKTVTRDELQRFADALSAWLENPPTKHFRSTPYQYRDVVFLAGTRSSWGLAQSTQECVASINNCYPSGRPPRLMQQIDQSEFEYRTAHRQPFLAHPEMNLLMALPPWLRMGFMLFIYFPFAAVPLAMLHALIFIKTRGPCPACGAPAARWKSRGLCGLLRCRNCRIWFRVKHRQAWRMIVILIMTCVLGSVWALSGIFFLTNDFPAFLLLIVAICGCLEIVERRWYLRYVFRHMNTEVELVRAKKLWCGIVR